MSVAVGRTLEGLQRQWCHEAQGGAQASTTLIPTILDLLQQAGLRLDALDAICFGAGPGSFTGLRTACAVAQGLAFGADIPVLPVDTLLAVAEEARWQRVQGGAADADLSVLAMLDARMDEVYSAAYQWSLASQSWQGVSALQVSAPEKVQAPDSQLLAGNVFEAYGPRLTMPGDRCQALPTAAALLRLAPSLWAQGLAVPAEQAMPLYIRDKVANTTAEREAMKAQAAQAKAAETP